MFNKIVNQLYCVSISFWYWISLIIGGILSLSVALIYQYVFDEWPCVLCIHIRLWISLLVITAFLGLLLRKYQLPGIVSNFTTLLVAIGLTERSYMLLGTERGFVFGDCGFAVGLPAWFAVEQWVPWLYRVEASCGYTPVLIFGITMSEALIVMSVGLLILTAGILLATLKKYVIKEVR